MAGFGGRDAFLGKPGLKWQLAPNPLVALDLGCSLPSMTVMGDALPLLCPAPSSCCPVHSAANLAQTCLFPSPGCLNMCIMPSILNTFITTYKHHGVSSSATVIFRAAFQAHPHCVDTDLKIHIPLSPARWDM